MENLKRNKGITLIALVITIIVILILAGVSISMLAGENGILRQATKAKDETEEKAIRESIRLAEIAARMENEGALTKEALEKELASTFGDEGFLLTEEKDENGKQIGYKITVGKVEETINENIEEAKKIVTASDIKDDKDAIGAEVNYVAPNDKETKWRIFFADENNIYLIAKDYIEREYLPQTEGGNKPDFSGKDKSATLRGMFEYYDGKWADMVNKNGIKDSLSKYHKWVDENKNLNESWDMMAIAYLLDTDIWNENYANKAYADYVIGGPTIEMFCISYNKKNNNIKEIEYNIDWGYKIKWKNDENYAYSMTGLEKDKYESLYIISSEIHADGMWLASPCDGDSALIATSSGEIKGAIYHCNSEGFRPVVCLKSTIQLKGNNSVGYSIIE